MKKIINVAVNLTKVETKEIEFDYPCKSKYFERVEEGRFFPRGLILFAIVPKYQNTFLLVEVERGIQKYDDFVPTKDCRQESWIKYSGIRNTAFEILTSNSSGFKEISKEDFHQKRTELLDCWRDNESNEWPE